MTSQLTPYAFDGAGVYAVRRDDTGLVKVGVTGNIKQRLRSLAPVDGRKRPLTLIAFVPGAQTRDERAIHERLACCHVHGEWFSDEALVLKVFHGWTVIPATDAETAASVRSAEFVRSLVEGLRPSVQASAASAPDDMEALGALQETIPFLWSRSHVLETARLVARIADGSSEFADGERLVRVLRSEPQRDGSWRCVVREHDINEDHWADERNAVLRVVPVMTRVDGQHRCFVLVHADMLSVDGSPSGDELLLEHMLNSEAA